MFGALILSAVVFVPVPAGAAAGWERKADMPTARSNFGVAALNGKVYVAGGYIEGSPDTVTDVVEVYDPGSNTWTTAAPLPGPRWAPVLVAVQGKLVLAGGADAATSSSVVNTTFVYDPAQDRWTIASPMPEARVWASGISVGGDAEVWCGAGPFPSSSTNTRFAYDVGTDTWTVRQSLPMSLTNFGLATVGQTAYTTGGWRNYPNVVSIQLPTGTWQEVSPMLKGRGAHASAELDGLVYAIAGVTADTTEDSPSRTVEAYSPGNDTWFRVADYPEPAQSLGAVRVGTTLYAMGGTISTASLRSMYALAGAAVPPNPPTSQPWALIGIAVAVGLALILTVVVMLLRSRRGAPPPSGPPRPA